MRITINSDSELAAALEVTDGRHRYRIYCFSDRSQTECFRDLLSGEDFDPRDRSRGTWLRGRGAAREGYLPTLVV